MNITRGWWAGRKKWVVACCLSEARVGDPKRVCINLTERGLYRSEHTRRMRVGGRRGGSYDPLTLSLRPSVANTAVTAPGDPKVQKKPR